jgi:glycosyltransferase involved in cell wall biosynthesis
MKVLLVGNYEFDGSKSMKVWAHTLLRELLERGIDAELICPMPILGRMKPSPDGLGKWLGYLDRFVLFPAKLRTAAAMADVVHICDHGSAMYALTVKNTPTVVTCHDLLAVRGALGEATDCPASFLGRRLQLWIRRGLERANRVACVSQFTLSDARRVLAGAGRLRVVLNGLNGPFKPLDSSEVERRLSSFPDLRVPFVLHVGSNLARKNREGVLRIFAQAAKGTGLRLVFAGAGMNRALAQLAKDLKVDDRIVEAPDTAVEILEALYNRALVLLFPSRYEGFGWPPIEAQACGCPVVASDIPPLVEVLGDTAAMRPLDDEAGMAEEIRKLDADPQYRDRLRQSGLENVRSRFQTSRMMDEYVSLYRELACQS